MMDAHMDNDDAENDIDSGVPGMNAGLPLILTPELRAARPDLHHGSNAALAKGPHFLTQIEKLLPRPGTAYEAVLATQRRYFCRQHQFTLL